MSARIALRVLAILLVPLSVARGFSAGGPWEKKPFAEWTAEDALRVLRDSPWSKISFIQKTAANEAILLDVPITRSETPGQHSTCCSNLGSPAGTVGSDTLARDAASMGSSRPVSQIPHYRVLFLSSSPVRKALVRLRQLKGEPVDPQVESILNHQPEDIGEIVVAVSGPHMAPFERATFESISAMTWLRSRKNRQKTLALKDFISPARRQDGMALFIFPRTVGARPAFDLEDEQIEFGTGDGDHKIRVSFKLGKMVIDGVLNF